MGANLPPTSQVTNLRKLGLTDEEIADVLATDKEIDQGAKHFELAEELKPGAKKARRADRTDTPKPAHRERKPNEDKRFLLSALIWAMTTDIEQPGDNVLATDVEIINSEREFLFTYNGIKYKVVLSAPRT
jgi:hypothetical protein